MSNCAGCPKEGNCPMQKADSWLKEHDSEIDELGSKTQEFFIETMAIIVCEHPILLKFKDVLADCLAQGVRIGYFCGRTYQDVPDIVKKAFTE